MPSLPERLNDAEAPGAISEAEDRLGMTEEQWAQWQAYTRGHGEQDANGVDVAAIRRNLRLTPSERLRRLEQAVNSMRKLQSNARASG